jgi:hypothetical protein
MSCFKLLFVILLIVVIVHASFTFYAFMLAKEAVTAAVESAPGYIDDYVQKNAGRIITEHIRNTVPEIVQNAIIGMMFSNVTAAAADAVPQRILSTDTKKKRAQWSGCGGGVHSEPLCVAFQRTCTSFAECTHLRTQASCELFATDLTYACSINRCDVYEDRKVCERVVTLCNNRFRAMWDAQARDAMELELRSLCSLLTA